MGENVEIGVQLKKYIDLKVIVDFIKTLSKSSIRKITVESIQDWEWTDQKEVFDLKKEIENNRILIANILLENDILIGCLYYKQDLIYYLEPWIDRNVIVNNFKSIDKFSDYLSTYLCKNYSAFEFDNVYIGVELYLDGHNLFADESDIFQWIFPNTIPLDSMIKTYVYKKINYNGKSFYCLRNRN